MAHLLLNILDALLDAVRAYQKVNRRWITFEYVMLHGLNDPPADAYRLIELVRDIACKINVIPWNPIEDDTYARPPQPVIDQFVEILANAPLTATVRYSKGDDIAAGCGQLYQELLEPAAP